MILTSPLHYVGKIMIPSSSVAPLNEAIARHESSILISLLGYPLYAEFSKAVDDSLLEANPIELDQKWKDLRDGATFSFTFNGMTINTKWDGLVNLLKGTLVPYYVYYKFNEDYITNFSGSSHSVTMRKDAWTFSSIGKMNSVWNDMVDMYGQVPRKYDDDFYKMFFLNIENYIFFNEKNSAYNYLLTNKEIFPNWIFEPKFKQTFF